VIGDFLLYGLDFGVILLLSYMDVAFGMHGLFGSRRRFGNVGWMNGSKEETKDGNNGRREGGGTGFFWFACLIGSDSKAMVVGV